MKNSKVTAKERSSKRSTASRGITVKSKSSVKVVEVRLKGKAKPEKKSADSSKKQVPVAAKKAPAKSAAPKAASVKKQAMTTSTLKSKANKPLHQVAAVVSQPELTIIEVPTEKLLRPFRKMAEKNRMQARASEKAEKAARGSFLAKPIKKGKKYYADLRVHTPGTVGYFAHGGIEPGPALVRLATVKGLHMIGLADYYNGDYIDQVKASATGSELVVIPGVILCCEVLGCREVFLLVLFPESAGSSEIFNLLNELKVPQSAYGRRDYCLSADFGEVLATIDRHGAIAIPSRVDKTPYRQLAIPQLVEKYGLHCFDLAHPDSPELFRERWPGGLSTGGFTFFSFSSANALGQIGNRVGKICMSQPSFAALRAIVKRDEATTVVEQRERSEVSEPTTLVEDAHT